MEDNIIFFSKKDISHVMTLHDDALVIIAKIDGFDTKRISVDGDSSKDNLLLDTFENMRNNKKELKRWTLLLSDSLEAIFTH